MARFDVLGIGLNATDTVLIAPKFPPYGGKITFEREILSAGGQVATAMVACARLGLRAKYIGTVGDDDRGRFQLESLKDTGVDVEHLRVRPGAITQTAYILIDRSTGERTIIWRRSEDLKLAPSEIFPEHIRDTRLLLIDGHDMEAAFRASQLAREAGIPVIADVDTAYPDFACVLRHIDYFIAAAEFPEAWTGEGDPFKALEALQAEYGMRVAAVTLGAYGALARLNGKFIYSPGFVVDAIDTTGAGDVFHGAFCYAVLKSMPICEALEFSNAMAALNCTAVGARGGIRTYNEVRELTGGAGRRYNPEIQARAQVLANS